MKVLLNILFVCLTISNLLGQTEKELRREVLIKKDTAKITAYLNLAKYYYINTGKGDSLLTLGSKALKLSKKSKSEYHEIDALIYIGTSYQVAGNYPKTEDYWQLAAKKATENKDDKRMTSIHNKMGALYYNWEKLDQAIPHFLQAAKSAEAIKDYDQSCLAYYGVSSIYVMLKQDDKRLEYIQKALEIIRKHPITKTNKNIIYTYASQHYLELSDSSNSFLDSAELYAQIGLDLSRKNDWSFAKPSYLNVLGAIAFIKKDWNTSKQLTEEALSFGDLIKEDTKFSVFLRKAELASIENNANDAFKFLNTVKNSPLINEDYFLLNYSKVAYKVYKKFGNSDLALESLETQDIVKDRMRKKEDEKLVFELEKKYKTELKDAEIEQLNQQKKINDLEIENKRAQLFWIAGLSAIVLLMAMIVVFIYRQRAANQKIKTFESEQRLNRARIDPHFFFNALSSIQTMALKEQSPNTALVLAKFTKVMRQSLESTYMEMNTIEDEFAFLQQYLELQKLRYTEKFEYELDVSEDLEVNEVQIPSMLLQPFIENSIEHGFKNMQVGGRIVISVLKKVDKLEINVSDNGEPSNDVNINKSHKSRATEIIKDRLFLLKKQTGKDAFFEVVVNDNQIGYQIKLTLPLIYKEI